MALNLPAFLVGVPVERYAATVNAAIAKSVITPRQAERLADALRFPGWEAFRHDQVGSNQYGTTATRAGVGHKTLPANSPMFQRFEKPAPFPPGFGDAVIAATRQLDVSTTPANTGELKLFQYDDRATKLDFGTLTPRLKGGETVLEARAYSDGQAPAFNALAREIGRRLNMKVETRAPANPTLQVDDGNMRSWRIKEVRNVAKKENVSLWFANGQLVFGLPRGQETVLFGRMDLVVGDDRTTLRAQADTEEQNEAFAKLAVKVATVTLAKLELAPPLVPERDLG